MRSLCSLVCKWNYEIGADGREIGWNEGFRKMIGLEDLASELSSASRLGKVAKSPGSALGRVCPAFAEECVLPLEAVVGASMIDAHAGALGMLACKDARFSSTCIKGHWCGCSVLDVPVAMTKFSV